MNDGRQIASCAGWISGATEYDIRGHYRAIGQGDFGVRLHECADTADDRRADGDGIPRAW